MRLLLLILTAFGCCSCSTIAPPKIRGVMGKNATFTLTLPPEFQVRIITWSFSTQGSDSVPVFSFALESKESPVTGYTGRVFFNETTYELKLGPLTLADSGIYRVTLLDTKYLSNTADTKLEVLEPVADVVIISSLSEAVEFNSTVTLTCSAKGSFLTYNWMNGSVPVVADGKHLLMNGSQLIVTGVLRTDLRGPVYCTAGNLLESLTSTAFNLSVSYGPERVMTNLPDNTVLKKGSNLTLSCSAVSTPAADFSWFFNGVSLSQKTTTLALPNMGENQSGNYSCVAYNSKTMRSVTSKVATVSIIESISGTNITGPSSLLIAGKSNASLTCKAGMGRADSVSWVKHGKPLAATERIIFTADKSMIIFLTVQKEDAGNYQCHLTNKVSNDTSSYKMEIFYGPEKVAIEGPKKVEVGDVVVMKCLVASFPPATYVWKLNGSLLEVALAEYKIEKPDYKSSGTYTCEAHNTVTGLNQTATHNLIVKGEGELNDQLSDGAIAAIVIAVLLAVAIIIAVIVRKRRKPREISSPY